jgi:hypothetical protein
MPASVHIYDRLVKFKIEHLMPVGLDDYVFLSEYSNRNTAMEVLGRLFRRTLKDSEIEKKDSLLRRTAGGADEMKKKLSQAEMKLRQITQTTLRDMKVKAKDQANEIEVLKEMVKSATK